MIILQKGFNYSQDGPGNRLVYHLQGCNFRCKWCSNPESMEMKNDKATIVKEEEIIKEIQSCRPMFFEGGGVTFTGGECTLQHNELLKVLKETHTNGINTCIETNGSDNKLEELLPYIDFLIIDLKQPDEVEHEKWTGINNRTTKENIGKVLDSNRQVLIRIPLIKHVNVCPEKYVEFFKQHSMVNAEIEILPYHEYGKDKWTKDYQMKDGFVTKDDIVSMVDAFKKEGYIIINT